MSTFAVTAEFGHKADLAIGLVAKDSWNRQLQAPGENDYTLQKKLELWLNHVPSKMDIIRKDYFSTACEDFFSANLNGVSNLRCTVVEQILHQPSDPNAMDGVSSLEVTTTVSLEHLTDDSSFDWVDDVSEAIDLLILYSDGAGLIAYLLGTQDPYFSGLDSIILLSMLHDAESDYPGYRESTSEEGKQSNIKASIIAIGLFIATAAMFSILAGVLVIPMVRRHRKR
jgi:hypothetical protein